MTKYQMFVAIIFVTTVALAVLGVIVRSLFPKTEDDATDPYADEFPGLYAPRENDNG